jgi:hypothetical protein
VPDAIAHADVVGGAIVLQAPLAALLLCGKIPGGRWDTRRRAWIYPATPRHARILGVSIPNLQPSAAFCALAGVPAAATEVNAPPPATKVIDTILPPGLSTRPWRHQVTAYNFCRDHIAEGMGGLLLAMGMGTGKSLVACMLALGLDAKRILIACPLRVVPVWLTQFDRHVSAPAVVVGLDEDAGSVADKRAAAEEKMRLADARDVPFICAFNYDSAWREPFADWAEKQNWDLVIADEAHRIKAPGGKASLFFKRLRPRAKVRIALTGTPLPHGPMDIYAVFRFLDATIFGPSFSAFRQKYAVMGGFQLKQITGFQKLDELEKLMSRITFRVPEARVRKLELKLGVPLAQWIRDGYMEATPGEMIDYRAVQDSLEWGAQMFDMREICWDPVELAPGVGQYG